MLTASSRVFRHVSAILRYRSKLRTSFDRVTALLHSYV